VPRLPTPLLDLLWLSAAALAWSCPEGWLAPLGWGGVIVWWLRRCFTPHAAWLLLAALTLHAATVWHWLAATLHTYAPMPWLPAWGITLVFGGYLALFPLFSLLLLRRFGDGARALTLSGLAVVFWGLGQFAQGWLFTGIPWMPVETAWVDWPVLAGLLPILGGEGTTLLVLALLVLATAPGVWDRLRTVPLALGGALLLVGWGAGGWVDAQAERGEPFSVAVVQGNIAQNEKWRPGRADELVKHHLDLTPVDADWSVWAETVLPFFILDDARLLHDLEQGIAARQTRLILGAPVRSEETFPPGDFPPYRNGMLLFDSEGRPAGLYGKVHLVPFGEYLPMPGIFGFLNGFQMGIGAYHPSKMVDRALPLGPGRPGGLICYESIFPELSRAWVRRGADVLVNITNDAWFGISQAPWQHLQHARLRAAENRRSVVRAANTGISALIDERGVVTALLPLERQGVVQGWVSSRRDTVPSLWLAPTLEYGSALAGLIYLLAAWLRRRRSTP